MATQRTIHSILAAGTLVLATLAGLAATAQPAEARIVVRLTPRVRVVTPRPARVIVKPAPVVVVSPRPVTLTRHDRAVARRLAAATRYSQPRLLNLRAKGHSWTKVGRILEIRPALIRASL